MGKVVDIHIKVDEKVKIKLQEKAVMSQKSLSQYLVEAGMESNYNSEKSKFYHNINSALETIELLGNKTEEDLLYVKEMNFVNSRMLMMSLLYQLAIIDTIKPKNIKGEDAVETVKKIYDESFEDAVKHFKEKE